MQKKIQGVFQPPRPHWVGDGFFVRSLFSYNDSDKALSPFLLLDHVGPQQVEPSDTPRGVGVHPHRGFETVSIVYDGEIAHRDSTGAGGTIGPGDVQWMTAGAGILHEELYSEAFTHSGGKLESAQVWVNLPAEHKLSAPRYQNLLDKDIPSVDLPENAGRVRVIAGEFAGSKGPALTFTPINMWDVRLNAGASAELPAIPGHTLALVVLRGTLLVNGQEVVREGQLVQMEREGDKVTLEANNDVTLLWLSGEPIDEPVVGYGPFVMNTQAEIRQAMVDMQTGQFGQIAPSVAESTH